MSEYQVYHELGSTGLLSNFYLLEGQRVKKVLTVLNVMSFHRFLWLKDERHSLSMSHLKPHTPSLHLTSLSPPSMPGWNKRKLPVQCAHVDRPEAKGFLACFLPRLQLGLLTSASTNSAPGITNVCRGPSRD